MQPYLPLFECMGLRPAFRQVVDFCVFVYNVIFVHYTIYLKNISPDYIGVKNENIPKAFS